jgi:starch synthase (maltosyl-transferring)
MPEDGRRRVVIEAVAPAVDGARFAVKRVAGERCVVEADAFTDGHDAVAAVLRFRLDTEPEWAEVPMAPLGNDRWRAEFQPSEVGRYLCTIEGWIDRFLTWREDLRKRVDADQDVRVDLQIGAQLVEEAAARAGDPDARRLREAARALRITDDGAELAIARALDAELEALMNRYPDRSLATQLDRQVPFVVDRERARYGAWYELFPRSWGTGKTHGTFRDVEEHLPYVAEMGFDVLYLPPVHPLGMAFRKGKNNSTEAGPEDPGSPWGIGAEAGGHTAVHPELGTLADFRRLVLRARQLGLEVALDIAFQCSPDHPWVREHPEWFRTRPDGTVQYAENPPKKYQDIYPINFETPAWRELWAELKQVILFWIDYGVRIFRVDNPHTKPFPFWEWLIGEIKALYPDVIFLAEAFTRPKIMYRLAKLGFSQSYTYFAWRNTKWELEQYFIELTQSEVREFYRPNLWPNTPDILTEQLQLGGRAAFVGRFVLAATLGASYGIYGPAFELMEHRPLRPGSEEYLNSEKYEIRDWNLEQESSLSGLVGRVNHIRREHPALQSDLGLRFHPIDNEQIIAYSKRSPDGDTILTVVSLDPHHAQAGWLELDLEAFDLDPRRSFAVHDLLNGQEFLWSGPRNRIELRPEETPARIYHIRPRLRTERDFEYFL